MIYLVVIISSAINFIDVFTTCTKTNISDSSVEEYLDILSSTVGIRIGT